LNTLPVLITKSAITLDCFQLPRFSSPLRFARITMNNRHKTLFFSMAISLIAVLLAGCTVYDAPFSTEPNVKPDERFTGIWQDGNKIRYANITILDNANYEINISAWSNEDEKPGYSNQTIKVIPYRIPPHSLAIVQFKSGVETKYMDKWIYYLYYLKDEDTLLYSQIRLEGENPTEEHVTKELLSIAPGGVLPEGLSTQFAAFTRTGFKSVPEVPPENYILSVKLRQSQIALAAKEAELKRTKEQLGKTQSQEKPNIAAAPAVDSAETLFDKGEELRKSKNFGAAFEKYSASAKLGFAKAENAVGDAYYEGEGVAKNVREAYKWFRLAADQGYDKGQYNLGYCYINGEGVAKNVREAYKWFRLAADQGHDKGQYWLGWCYYKGEGVAKNVREAYKWYRLAADQGYAPAQVWVGTLHGLEDNNQVEAVKWYRKAVNQGDAMAMSLLGHAYLTGKGVEKNYTQAFKYLLMADAGGDEICLNNIGWCYLNGYGVDKDLNKAASYFRRAAALGDENAKQNLKNLRNPPKQQAICRVCHGDGKQFEAYAAGGVPCNHCGGSGIAPY